MQKSQLPSLVPSQRSLITWSLVCGLSAAVACSSDPGADGASASEVSTDGTFGKDPAKDACLADPCSCCAAGTVCSFRQCVAPGAACVDSSECAPTEYCAIAPAAPRPAPTAGGACQGGAVVPSGRCLPKPPVCADDRGAGVSCLAACKLPRSTEGLAPTVKYGWGGQVTAPFASDVMMTPIVTQLDDDDCDGRVSADDIPDIVFTTFAGGAYQGVGTVRAITVKDGKLVDKWSVGGLLNASGQLASGNIDGAPGNEIVGCGPSKTVALRGDGSVLWTSPRGCATPALADLDGDGAAEVIVEGAILDGKTGKVEATFAGGQMPTIADIDGDGKQDIVSGGAVYRADGSVLADTGTAETWSAIADLDLDGKPEIVSIDTPRRSLSIWRYDAAAPGHFAWVRKGVDLLAGHDPARCPSTASGGGPPTIGDFNGDGTPDVALAGSVAYVVFDGKKLMAAAVPSSGTTLWSKVTQDCSSAATGSSLFDFDGDGKPEVTYGDEVSFRIYDGATGKDLFSTCNTTGTLIEYPVIADVDNDGHADIVVASNAYAAGSPGTSCAGGAATSGIRVFSGAAGNWVRTRRIWNQHAYSVTNVEEDGTIPKSPRSNWLVPGLNNFRQNKQPGQELAAADAVVSLAPKCNGDSAVLATVQNLGEAVLPAGVVVEIRRGAGDGAKVAEATTTTALYPAQAQTLTVAVPAGVAQAGGERVFAQLVLPATIEECRADNNRSADLAACAQPR